MKQNRFHYYIINTAGLQENIFHYYIINTQQDYNETKQISLFYQ